MRKSNQCIGLIFIILAMIGCDNDLVSEENKTFADFNWSETDTTRFELVVNDTTPSTLTQSAGEIQCWILSIIISI